MTKNKIENTTKTAQENPAGILLEALAHGPGGGHIEAMEARGQRQLAASSVLPSEGLERAWADACGIRIGNPVQGDDLFMHVELPSGWKIEPTDHAMWSKLLDDKGRERAGIFYKATYYDRKAHLELLTRFACRTEYPEDYKDDTRWVAATDAGAEVWRSANFDARDYGASDRATAEGEAWLRARYPDWKNPAAYWNDHE